MKSTKENLKDGVWYKILPQERFGDTILKYQENKEASGYWRGRWDDVWVFATGGNWEVEEATKEDLAKLGKEWEPYWEEDKQQLAITTEDLRQYPLTPDECFDSEKLPTNNLDETVTVSRVEREFKATGNIAYKGESTQPEFQPKIREFEGGSKRDDDSDKPLVNHLDPYLRLRFGYLLREGANKYDKGNWRKLQPTETALESLHRHLAKFEKNLNDGVEQDEDHLSCVIFNVMLILKNEEKQGVPVDHFYGTLK